MKYYVPDYGETVEDANEIVPKMCSNPMHDRETVASIAEFKHRISWWENSWPIDIILVSDDGVESKWSCDRQMVPEFWATKSK